MQVEITPTAAGSYARTLIERGCPPPLAVLTGKILARLDGDEPSPYEKALIARTYANLTH